jgi:hypothetical protein
MTAGEFAHREDASSLLLPLDKEVLDAKATHAQGQDRVHLQRNLFRLGMVGRGGHCGCWSLLASWQEGFPA